MPDSTEMHHWRENSLTRLFFSMLREERNRAVTDLTTHMATDQPNVVLQIGKLIGKINILDELLDTELRILFNLKITTE
jgi:hypothetical protein